jgi:hypothetical protein
VSGACRYKKYSGTIIAFSGNVQRISKSIIPKTLEKDMWMCQSEKDRPAIIFA